MEHNEVNGRLPPQILLPTFDGNESEVGGTDLRLKVCTKGKREKSAYFVGLLSHHITKSARHKLATDSVKKQKISTKVESFHYTDFL